MIDIDFKQIVQDLTPERIIELVTELGSDEYVDKGDYIMFKTICHNEDAAEASLKLYYYKSNRMFHCYTDCGESFNIYGLFKRRYELLGIKYSFYNDIVLKICGGHVVKREYNGFYHKYEQNYDKYKKGMINVNLPSLNPSILSNFCFNPTPEWLNDGIGVAAMEHYNILYSISRNKIIIPHYNDIGDLIGIRGRALNEEDLIFGKYMPVTIEGKNYAHPLMYNLYGLNVVKDNIKKFKMAIVAESEKSCLQYETMFGKDNNICVACCGSTFHKYQLQLLLKYGAEKVLIAFDKEGETKKLQEKYFQKLYSICKNYSNSCKMGFIFDYDNILNLKESPFDKGIDTFKNLYKKAIWL